MKCTVIAESKLTPVSKSGTLYEHGPVLAAALIGAEIEYQSNISGMQSHWIEMKYLSKTVNEFIEMYPHIKLRAVIRE